MPDVQWIKVVTDLFDNEKITYIESLHDADSILVIWFKLLLLGGKINRGGSLMLTENIPYTMETLATNFRRSPKKIMRAFEIFLQLNMLEVVDDAYYICNWGKYQSVLDMERIREQARLRMARYRQKKSDGDVTSDVTGDVTVASRYGDVTHIDVDVDVDVEKKNNKTTIIRDDRDDWFGVFWTMYPKRVAKKTARAKFLSVVKTEKIYQAIVNDLRIKTKSFDWIKEDGRYVPNPTTYLNQERWTDEYNPKDPIRGNGRVDVLPDYTQEDDRPFTEEDKKALFEKLASLKAKTEVEYEK